MALPYVRVWPIEARQISAFMRAERLYLDVICDGQEHLKSRQEEHRQDLDGHDSQNHGQRIDGGIGHSRGFCLADV